MELQVHFFARRGCRVGSAERVFSMGGKLYHGDLAIPPQIARTCRYCNGVLNGLQHPCTPTNTPYTPIPKIPHIWVFSKSNFIFLKSRYIATSSKLRDSARARLNGARGTCAYFPRAIRESPASIPQNNRLRKTNFNPQIILHRARSALLPSDKRNCFPPARLESP